MIMINFDLVAFESLKKLSYFEYLTYIELRAAGLSKVENMRDKKGSGR